MHVLVTNVQCVVLHPSIRLAYFEDISKWDKSIATRARVLLEHLHEVYSAEDPLEKTTNASVPTGTTWIFLDVIRDVNPAQTRATVSELDAFFSGTYPCVDSNVLHWWKVSLFTL
jgi:hypothetical protein